MKKRSQTGPYCNEDDCYDLLGHLDKNPDPETRKQFFKIVNAYEQTDHRLTLIANCVSDEAIKSDLVHRRLWVKANMESYLVDMRKESKRRR
ncbi:hypothetical protein ACLOJK_024919 [Asimina triloba]